MASDLLEPHSINDLLANNIHTQAMNSPTPKRRQSRHRVRLDPILESEKAPRTFIPDYDPARSANEFLATIFPEGKPALQTADNESGHFRIVGSPEEEREFNREQNQELLHSLAED